MPQVAQMIQNEKKIKIRLFRFIFCVIDNPWFSICVLDRRYVIIMQPYFQKAFKATQNTSSLTNFKIQLFVRVLIFVRIVADLWKIPMENSVLGQYCNSNIPISESPGSHAGSQHPTPQTSQNRGLIKNMNNLQTTLTHILIPQRDMKSAKISLHFNTSVKDQHCPPC